MAKPTKRNIPGGMEHTGRVTMRRSAAAGSTASSSPAASSAAAARRPSASSRYTPPAPAGGKLRSTGQLVPIVMFTLLGVGVLMIIVNYMSVLLPGAPSNWYIVGGLGLILAGIMVATQWR